jgi:uncharacterized membrane protein
MTNSSSSTEPSRSVWKNEVYDLIRGASGGFLFGIPLIYTMEVWWIGSYIEPPLMLAVLAATYAIVFLLNRTDGFRQLNPNDSLKAAMDSVEALAISLICTTLILILESTSKKIERNHFLNDVGATLIGAIFIAFNISPTDEIPMLSAAVSPPWLLAIIAASLVISYGIVFAAGFTTQEVRIQHEGLFQRPLEETLLSYFVPLAVAAAMLWFFHRLDFSDPWTLWLHQTLLLGFPATIGGAAGRLAT